MTDENYYPPIMLVLRGIAGHFDGKDWPRGALDEQPALDYATKRGYQGLVLDIAGATGANSPQVTMALRYIRANKDIAALYGFSGGGYNVHHILDALNEVEKAQLKLVVILGAPNNDADLYMGPWELVYRVDPAAGHMAGPRVLLESLA